MSLPLSILYNRVLPHLPGLPSVNAMGGFPLVDLALLDSLIELCERSMIWKQEITFNTIAATVQTTSADAPPGSRVIPMSSVGGFFVGGIALMGQTDLVIDSQDDLAGAVYQRSIITAVDPIGLTVTVYDQLTSDLPAGSPVKCVQDTYPLTQYLPAGAAIAKILAGWYENNPIAPMPEQDRDDMLWNWRTQDGIPGSYYQRDDTSVTLVRAPSYVGNTALYCALKPQRRESNNLLTVAGDWRNLSAWSQSNGTYPVTVASDPYVAPDGNPSQLLSFSTSASSELVCPVIPLGGAYSGPVTFSAWVQGAAGAQFGMRVVSESTVATQLSDIRTLPNSDWNRMQVTATLAGVTNAKAVIGNYQNTAGLALRVSGVQVEKAASASNPGYMPIPDWIYERYAEQIARGALSRLLVMPKKPWTDPQRATFYMGEWEADISIARTRSHRGGSRAPLRTRAMYNLK